MNRPKALRRLKRRQTQIIEHTPSLREILRSTISRYYLTCGYKKCWCHQGKKKHGPYIYLSAKEKGKLRMRFVPKELIKEVKEGVRNYNKLWNNICEIARINKDILWLEKKGK